MKNYEIKTLKRSDWPPLLKEINDPPEKLYFAGQIPDYKRKLLCVVGSRKYTNYGREAVEFLIRELANYPITIVSGLALGIDSIAHRAALKNNLPTIAIPGSGLDPKALHPQSHVNLAEEIVQNDGTLISEMEPEQKASLLMHDTAAKKVFFSFPRRNRIMAGMSHAILVVEAEMKSGTLITSKLATEYNREVLTIPGSIFSPHSDGPHMLLRLGATPIRSAEDILEALGVGELDLNYESGIMNHKNEKGREGNPKKYSNCSANELIIIEILKEPLERDEILRRAREKHQIPISETQTLLTLLELKGLINEHLGQIHLT
ncbi:MAG: DNA-processing protein DprA [Candidatus Zambryskibacteria bacterium]|nr:DNA-processing protein DprA [Candidatus Zambryskibacteria bacterium]